jgi:general secretion pathway protein G
VNVTEELVVSKKTKIWVLVSIAVSITSVILFTPLYFGHTDTKLARAKSDIDIISKALEMYRNDHGTYPTTTQGLSILIDQKSKTYLDSLPFDPWGNEYQYHFPGVHNLDGYDLSSHGPTPTDGNEESELRIGNWDTLR